MKKLIIIILFIPSICLGQDGFRKMKWGDSPQKLGEYYPNTTFTIEPNRTDYTIFTHPEIVGGILSTVMYFFFENKLVTGMYIFDPVSSKSGMDRLRDFKSISALINKKYSIEREDKWHKTTWINSPNYLDFALEIGDVDIIETCRTDRCVITHNLYYKDGKLNHSLTYGDYVHLIKSSIDDYKDIF